LAIFFAFAAASGPAVEVIWLVESATQAEGMAPSLEPDIDGPVADGPFEPIEPALLRDPARVSGSNLRRAIRFLVQRLSRRCRDRGNRNSGPYPLAPPDCVSGGHYLTRLGLTQFAVLAPRTLLISIADRCGVEVIQKF
jgi:hypothetical protein